MRYVEATAPAVIDEGLSRACIQLLQPKEHSQTGVELESQRNATATKQATLPFGEVECLMFSFKNILKINNLLGFDKLVKLYLDNNVIVKIEHLDHLTHLEWLDLSFNNIEQIRGLDKLTKLENLSLFNNRIDAIEGLDALTGCLQVLSLGNNRLADLEQTKVLRKFQKLHAVTLAGNPMAGKDEYRPFVLSHLRSLRFLDYRLVDEAEVVQAESDGTLQEKLQEIRAVEAAHEETRELERKAAERSALLADAHMAAADGFWAQMEAATAEPNAKVNVVEPVLELHAKQRPKFESRLEEFVQANLLALGAKAAELREYREAAATMQAENDADAHAHLATFNALAKSVKKIFAQAAAGGRLGAALAAASDEDSARVQAIVELKAANELLYDQLLELEMMQVDQFIAAIDAFEAAYTAMHTATLEQLAATFNATRELAATWVAEAHEVATLKVDEFVAHNLNDSDDVSDELKAALNDKDGLLAALAAANELRISFLDATEDKLAKAEKRAFNTVISELRDGEHRRNRERVNEVSHLVRDIHRELIDDLEATLDTDEL